MSSETPDQAPALSQTSPTVGSASACPLGASRERDTGGTHLPAPQFLCGALGHNHKWKTGRAASKLKLENETGNHSLTPPNAGVSFPRGLSLREKDACAVRAVGSLVCSLTWGWLSAARLVDTLWA